MSNVNGMNVMAVTTVSIVNGMNVTAGITVSIVNGMSVTVGTTLSIVNGMTVTAGRLIDVVSQLVERRPRDPMDSMTRGSNPVRSTIKHCESFSESKCCTDSLSVCPTPVWISTHKNVRTLRIL